MYFLTIKIVSYEKYIFVFLLLTSCIDDLTTLTARVDDSYEELKMVSNPEDVQRLIDTKKFPLSKFSQETLENFKSSFIFEDGRLRGFGYAMLVEQLSNEEVNMLFDLISANTAVVVFEESGIGEIDSRNSNCCPPPLFLGNSVACPSLPGSPTCCRFSRFNVCVITELCDDTPCDNTI